MRGARGFTLIELMIVLAIVAILLATAVPSFVEQVALRRLEGVANELSADLQYARTEAISKNKQVIVTATGTGYSVNYVVSPVTPALKTITLPNGVTVNSTSVTFDPLRGMSTGAVNLNLSSSSTSASLRVSSSAVGLIQLCSPDQSFKGYKLCV